MSEPCDRLARTRVVRVFIVFVFTALSLAVPLTAGARKESRHAYALRWATCDAVNIAPPQIYVHPPRMWALYDTTGRKGQRVRWRAVLWGSDDNSSWRQFGISAWEYGWARNEVPAGFDPGNLATYTMGAWIFTGARHGNAATEFDAVRGWFIKYTGYWRVTVEMRWFGNRWAPDLFRNPWNPFHDDAGGRELSCIVEN